MDNHKRSIRSFTALDVYRNTYHIEPDLCERLIDLYDKASRQLYKLSLAWTNFKERRHPIPSDETDTWPKP